MALTSTPQTRPRVLALPTPVAKWDLIDEFNRVFWVDVDPEAALKALNETWAFMWRVVPSTGRRQHGDRVVWA
jgi:hypothetical protein